MAWTPRIGPGRGSGRGVRGVGGPGGGPGPLVQACRVKLRRLRGPKKSKIWPIFAFLHLNRDPARPEGALLGLWRVLRTPWTPSGPPWEGPWDPPEKGISRGFGQKCPFGGVPGGLKGPRLGDPGRSAGVMYIEGFNMYT